MANTLHTLRCPVHGAVVRWMEKDRETVSWTHCQVFDGFGYVCGQKLTHGVHTMDDAEVNEWNNH